MEEFETQNLALVAYLRCVGFEHDSLRQIDGRGVWCFKVEDPVEFNMWREEFDGGHARVEPRDFMVAQRRVREELYRTVGKAA